jgi:membrane protease YdiL (CAAX protease family)
MTESGPDRQRADGEILGWSVRSFASRIVALVAVVALFGLAQLLGRATVRSAGALFVVGDPGTVSNLVVGVVGLQVLGFGAAAGLFLSTREREWRRYLRLSELSAWTVFYGTAVGLALMIVVSLATGVFSVLDVEPTESAVVRATDPLFYLVLFAVSTAVVVPMEEVFFRGVVQRHLSEQFHVGVAVGVASLLFALIHTTTVGTGGDVVELGMFVSLGVVLGISYYHTENLFVPIVGHACFNGVQILVRAVEVTL